MGLGADLLWTSVLKALHARNGKRTLLCDRPRLSDILAGVPYDRASKRRLSPVFAGNPHVEFPPSAPKNRASRILDNGWECLTKPTRVPSRIEDHYYRRSAASNFASLYLDLPQHGYVERIEKDRYVWKPGGHIIDILASSVGLSSVPHECELHMSADDEKTGRDRIAGLGVSEYVTIEPATNPEFFGELRSWPFDRWQEVVNWITKTHRHLAIIQVGTGNSRILDGVVNMCGKTSFQEAAILIRSSRAFLGTEGGLMHCANAMHAPAVILWGGLTDPDFAAYPDKHTVVHHKVACAPCGRLGHCPHARECMLSITPAEVIAALGALLAEDVPATRVPR